MWKPDNLGFVDGTSFRDLAFSSDYSGLRVELSISTTFPALRTMPQQKHNLFTSPWVCRWVGALQLEVSAL